MNWMGVAAIGIAVGFLAGMFGKGGSAIATPLLHAVGIPAIVAVAAPLPATIPSTAVASYAYSKERLVEREVLTWSLAWGVPATIAGALATRWISGGALVTVTDVVVAALGLRFLIAPQGSTLATAALSRPRLRLALVSLVVGVAAGLLANSGGFLLAPLYMTVLRMPIRSAFASSLAVAVFLAVPGTLVHWLLGHIDWSVVAVFALTSIPFSYAGARAALRTEPARLERIYGAALLGLGAWFLLR